jgi:hypothetical protein
VVKQARVKSYGVPFLLPHLLSPWFSFLLFPPFFLLPPLLPLLPPKKLHYSIIKATPAVIPDCRCYFFGKTEKKFSNISPSQVVIYLKLGKQTPRAHICAHLSAVYPSISEEVEGTIGLVVQW